MIEQISGVLLDVLDGVMARLLAAGPMPGWAYPVGWAFVGGGAATLAFLAGVCWGTHGSTDATPTPARRAEALDATAVLPRVPQPAPRRHRRATRFALPRRAKTTRAQSGTSRSIKFAPGKAAPRQ